MKHEIEAAFGRFIAKFEFVGSASDGWLEIFKAGWQASEDYEKGSKARRHGNVRDKARVWRAGQLVKDRGFLD